MSISSRTDLKKFVAVVMITVVGSKLNAVLSITLQYHLHFGQHKSSSSSNIALKNEINFSKSFLKCLLKTFFLSTVSGQVLSYVFVSFVILLMVSLYKQIKQTFYFAHVRLISIVLGYYRL